MTVTELPEELPAYSRQASAHCGHMRATPTAVKKGHRRIDPRIARLALNSAGSVTLFLIETWERNQHRALPQHAGGAAVDAISC